MQKYVILGHKNPDNDSIVSGYLLEKLMKRYGYNAEFIIPDETISEENIELANYVGIDPTKYQKPLPQDSTIKFILVDHHERNVPGEIISIIDHHPTTKQIKCKYYRNESACSTSCLIVKDRERYFTYDDIKAACFASMVDTAAFHSNKTTIRDYNWVKYLCLKFNFNYNEMLTKSLQPTFFSNIEQASLNGLKEHTLNNHKIASSFLHIENKEEFEDTLPEITDYLKQYIANQGYDLFAFIVHDISNFQTTLYKISPTETTKTEYPEYTSRGNKIIPSIEKELTKSQKKKTIN